MPGFERNRFIDLTDNIGDSLTCIVCFNIFDNPVITDCGHTYCYACLETNIRSGSKECPNCRQSFLNRRSLENNENHLNITNDDQSFFFVRNLIVNSMVNNLRVKCDNASKGCQSVMQLSSLDSHLKQCEYSFCKRCGLKTGNIEKHNCLQLLKNGFYDYRIRFEKCDRILKDIIQKYTKLEKQNQTNLRVWRLKCQMYEYKIEELKNMVTIMESNLENKLLATDDNSMVSGFVEDVDFVMFGTLETKCLHCQVNSRGIELKGISHNLSQDFGPENLFISFAQMQELKYCSETSSVAIIIKPTEKFSFELQKLIHIDQAPSHLCIYSYEPGKRYIIILLQRKSTKLGSTLFEWSNASNPQLKPALINWNSVQQLLYSSLGMTTAEDPTVESVIDSDY